MIFCSNMNRITVNLLPRASYLHIGRAVKKSPSRYQKGKKPWKRGWIKVDFSDSNLNNATKNTGYYPCINISGVYLEIFFDVITTDMKCEKNIIKSINIKRYKKIIR